MNKKCHKKERSNKKRKHNKKKLVCPLCHKNMKAKKLDNGYTLCAYCGMIVLKIPYTFEDIYAPGFVAVDPHRNKKRHKNWNKHHHLVDLKQYMKKYKQQ